jgi:hypothetical protein
MRSSRSPVRVIALQADELRFDPNQIGPRERQMRLVPSATTALLRYGGELPMAPDVRYEAGSFRVLDGVTCVAAALHAGRPDSIECVVVNPDEIPAEYAARTSLPRQPGPTVREVVEVLCFEGPVPEGRRQAIENRLQEVGMRLRAAGCVRFSDVTDPRWPEPAVLVWRTPYVDNPDDLAGLRELHELLSTLAAESPPLIAWNGRALWR